MNDVLIIVLCVIATPAVAIYTGILLMHKNLASLGEIVPPGDEETES